MKYGIIGAGKLGCSIGIALKNKGYLPVGVYSRSDSSYQFLCNQLSINRKNSYISAIEDSEIVFITVKDSMIKQVAEEIAGILPVKSLENKLFFHCSGATTSDALDPIAKKNGIIASLHPLQTFPDRETGWRNLSNIYFGFEGDRKAEFAAKRISDILDSSLLTINKEDKPIYHSIACIISNYTVALAATAGQLFKSIGIESDLGIKAMIPLLWKTVNNISEYGINNSISGPISRGDVDTVKKHIDALSEKELGVDVYKVLGEKMVELVYKNKLIDEECRKNINSLLKFN